MRQKERVWIMRQLVQSIKNLRRKVADTRSVRNKLKQKEQVVKEREAGRVHQTKQKNQGAR